MAKSPKEPKPSSDPKVAGQAERTLPKPWEHDRSRQKVQKPRPKQQLRRRP